MKRSYVFMTSIMLVLVIGAINALAEDSLETIISNNFPAATYHEITSNNNFEFTSGTYDVTIIAKDHQAGYVNPTGWYPVGSKNVKTQLFTTPGSEIGLTYAKKIDAKTRFGLYIDSNIGTFYSNPKFNPDISLPAEVPKQPASGQHVRCFLIDSGDDKGAYILGFEDLDKAHGSDWDYNDVVIEVKGATLGIPEFPSIVLPTAAVLGLVFIFGRKRKAI